MPTSSSSDIILVTELPDFEVVEGFLQFTLVSGSRSRVFRMSPHKARNSCMVALALLDRAERERSNVHAMRDTGKERAPRHS